MVNESNLIDYIQKAEAYLNEDVDPDNKIIITAQTDIGFAYVFYYNFKRYMETKNLLDCMTGNGPIIVTKIDGKFHWTNSANPLDYYLKPIKDNYELID